MYAIRSYYAVVEEGLAAEEIAAAIGGDVLDCAAAPDGAGNLDLALADSYNFV